LALTQVKAKCKLLLAQDQGLADVFRIQAYARSFSGMPFLLSTALPLMPLSYYFCSFALHSEGICVSIMDKCVCCRLMHSVLSQRQLPVLEQCSSYAIMLDSMLK
jgi:hypothetical protein